MKPKVYIETTVISYLTARPSRDVVIAGQQETTRQWWRTASEQFLLVTSDLVWNEAAGGDAEAAQARTSVLEAVEYLEATEEAATLGEGLVEAGAIPARAADDAAHIAIAVTNGVQFLVRWSCRHIANAMMRAKIERVSRDAGYEPPVICTPAELLEINHEEPS